MSDAIGSRVVTDHADVAKGDRVLDTRSKGERAGVVWMVWPSRQYVYITWNNGNQTRVSMKQLLVGAPGGYFYRVLKAAGDV